ncbi:MAG TPA: hypothetical protein VFN60_03290, partial [Acidimicrobiales bacterium]|nr:hypothetical protein [Acidimicrobiales bacterium]
MPVRRLAALLATAAALAATGLIPARAAAAVTATAVPSSLSSPLPATALPPPGSDPFYRYSGRTPLADIPP